MNDFGSQLFVILLVSGLVLVGAEIFVPGGILGFMGGIALFGAIILAFAAFGPAVGGYVTVGIILLVGFVIYLWAHYFPGTRIGKRMTVAGDLKDAKGVADGMSELVGKTGETLSDLRPGGFARIDGRRVDVITEGEMISRESSVKVTRVESNRVVVRLNASE
ncbi:MAG: NfeD family protein [Kiritimatiellia bacterium]